LLTVLFSIVQDQEQYGQQNIVQACFHQRLLQAGRFFAVLLLHSCCTACNNIDENEPEQYFAAHIVLGC
jgi:hypothetical protein